MGGFLDKYPSMFFGGKGSETFLHYDIDMAHIFHTHFNGRKKVLLFDNKWKERLYLLPFATYALEDYNIAKPDFEKFPALNGVQELNVTWSMVTRYLCRQVGGIIWNISMEVFLFH